MGDGENNACGSSMAASESMQICLHRENPLSSGTEYANETVSLVIAQLFLKLVSVYFFAVYKILLLFFRRSRSKDSLDKCCGVLPTF